MSQEYARRVYLVVDVSGSTARNGLNEAINRAMPFIVDGLALQPGNDIQLAVLAAGRGPRPVLGLTPACRIELIPHIKPERLGLLAPALDEVAATIAADSARAELDAPDSARLSARVAVVLICDGLPVDAAEPLRAAFHRVHDSAGSVASACVVMNDVLRTDLAALSGEVVAAAADPAALAALVVAAAVSGL